MYIYFLRDKASSRLQQEVVSMATAAPIIGASGWSCTLKLSSDWLLSSIFSRLFHNCFLHWLPVAARIRFKILVLGTVL